jgi:hypothetical protein
MNWTELIATTELWAYRVGDHAVLNVLDDPAGLALIVC